MNAPHSRWTRLNNNFKYRETTQIYAGIDQRWIIVENRESKYKELDTFHQKLEKEEQSLKK